MESSVLKQATSQGMMDHDFHWGVIKKEGEGGGEGDSELGREPRGTEGKSTYVHIDAVIAEAIYAAAAAGQDVQ